MAAGDLAVVAAAVPGATVIDPSGGLDHHVANPLRIEAGAAQDRFHDLVIEQIFEARLMAAAFCVSGHDPLRTYDILCNIDANNVGIVTMTGIFHDNAAFEPSQFSLRGSRRPHCLQARG